MSAPPADDQAILARINELMAEEHDLAQRGIGAGGHPEAARLEALEVEIDRYWDLLRQRRALRRAGRDPDEAILRPGGEVEHYQQ